MSTAYLDGRYANSHGKSIKSNPYCRESGGYKNWLDGWLDEWRWKKYGPNVGEKYVPLEQLMESAHVQYSFEK